MVIAPDVEAGELFVAWLEGWNDGRLFIGAVYK
jgi:hypothetical protein